MPDLAQLAPPKPAGSFASLLASLAGKLNDDPWDDSALEDDVTTLTYEQALRAHGRSRPLQSATKALPEEAREADSVSRAPKPKTTRSTGEQKSKSASITIRVTAEEQTKLHERAAAAQLSVSAYLRSCIFEAESLRIQVKEALAQMQSASPLTQISPQPERRSPVHFFQRWLRRGRTEN